MKLHCSSLRRILAVLLAASILSPLAGCKQTDGGEAAQETPSVSSAGTTVEASSEPEETELVTDGAAWHSAKALY